MNRSSYLAVAATLVAISGSALAQPFEAVVPAANANERGTGGLNTLMRDLPRTYQMQFVESELAAQGLTPGMVITGLTWRPSITTSNDPTWPPAGGATWQNYDITLAEAANPITNLSSTFADNMVNPVGVRSGLFTVPAGTFQNPMPPAPDPNPWGFEINFPGYIYQGGDLVMLVSHDGNDIGSNVFLDRVGSDDAWGRAISASTYNAPTGGSPSASFTITRFTYIPSPGTGALLALGGLVALRRRR